MQKVFILSKDSSFTRNMNLILDRQKYQVSTPEIHANTLFTYCCNFKPDICIIHNSFIQGYYQVFDLLISSRKCFVLYFSSIMELGSLYNVISSPRFFIASDEKLYGANELLEIMQKDTQTIESMEQEINRYKEKIEEERMVRKAKLAIMKYRKCSEDEAYKAILKKSMDERISKLLAAKKIYSEVEK